MDNHNTYDHNRNRTEKQQLGGNTRYTYDGQNRLTRVEYPGYTEVLYYDRAGNRRRRVSAGVEESYQYGPANHLTKYTKGEIEIFLLYILTNVFRSYTLYRTPKGGFKNRFCVFRFYIFEP